MHCLILRHEYLIELGLVDLHQLTQPLRKQPIKPRERPLLHAALQDHRAEFCLLILTYAQLEKLMTTLLEIDGAHDDQVNGTPQIYQVLLGHVFDFL